MTKRVLITSIICDGVVTLSGLIEVVCGATMLGLLFLAIAGFGFILTAIRMTLPPKTSSPNQARDALLDDLIRKTQYR